MKGKKTLALALCAATLLACAGCGEKKAEKTAGKGAEIKYGENTYPLQCDDTLTYWVQLNSVLSASTDNFGKSPLGKELEKRTGIKVEYIHPAQGQQSDQFSLLIASGELPDMIQTNWISFGAQKSIDSKYILPLNDIIKEWAPNLNAMLEKNEDMRKMIKTDEGNYYAFPFWRGDPYLCTYAGPIIRKDWLDELNLDVPETIDEWETMLRAFKEKKGVKKPLTMNNAYFQNGFLCGAFGVTQSFYLGDDGAVKFGPIEPGFKDFLILMNKWYKEKLLDNDIAGSPSVSSLMLSDEAGATIGMVGGSIGGWLENKASTGEKFDLVGAPYPVLKKGDKPQFAHKDWQYGPSGAVAITTQCKNPELAAKYLDYGFSKEGETLYNFGVEGESFEYKNGEPVFTDLILKNPEGNSIDNMIARYALSGSSGPFVHDRRAVDQTRPHKQQAEAIKNWSDTDVDKHRIPLITMTSEESRKYGNVMSEVNTYISTNMYSFINGKKSFDEYDAFVKEIKNFGIEDAIKIYEAALKRYNNR